jgi:CRP-like cAMP-binding protein
MCPMLEPAFPSVTHLLESAALVRCAAGTVLQRRGVHPHCALHVESGQVLLVVLAPPTDEADLIAHQLGVLRGPGWLDSTAAVLRLPPAMDAVAHTEVLLRRVPLPAFWNTVVASLGTSDAVWLDLARAHRQQTEWAVSRVAKDAEGRCAEWLLHHAQPAGSGGTAVRLVQRKRMIATELGIAPETLSRVLRQLRERRLISGAGRTLQLVDTEGLAALANA